MSELLQSVWNLLSGLLSEAADVALLLLEFVWSFLMHLHVDAPRLEGLLAGVVLAWLLMRRDSHPLLRVLSSPLKLVLDILDLAWDQVVEVVSDLWATCRDWVLGALGWAWGKVVSVYELTMGLLKGLKSRLSRSKPE